MRVASYNIHKCVGADRRCDPARVIAVIAELDADIVALQEVDRRFGDRGPTFDAADLRRGTGHVLLDAGSGPGNGWRGNAILVRGGAASATVRRIALPGIEPRGAVMADIDLGRGSVRLVAAHLGLVGRSRRSQARAIIGHIGTGHGGPVVVLGDLNEWRPGGGSLEELGSFLGFDHRRARGASFPARRPFLALDRIMVDPGEALAGFRVHDSRTARQASDHLPVTADLDPGILFGARRMAA